VRADIVSSLIVAEGERCGLIGVGFENMMRSWVLKGGAQQGLGVAASRWLGGGKAKAQGSDRLASPPCFVKNLHMYFGFLSQ